MNSISSSRATRLSRRSAGRLLVRRVTTASASAVQHHEPVPYPSHPLASTLEPSPSNRRQAIKQAKPFSDFLTDNFNRQHDYLRISVTERCNLRCTYCMPEEGVPLSPQAQLLTTPEIFYISSLFVSQGVTKIRLTGGEPTVRPDIVPLMQQIGGLRSKGLRELALTTNGISLHRKLDKMVEAGLTGLNISLDTLDPFQFQIMTRRKGFDAVVKSIDRVLEMNKLGAGVKLKVNCVVMRGINDREIIPFVEMGREKDIEVRFIEYMPFDGNRWSKRKMLPYSEMLDLIREKYPDVRKVTGHFNDTSKTYEVPGFKGKLGFITSMTHNFCGSCNRLRITGDGNLKVCLFGNAEVSLRDLIRQDNNNQPIDQQAFEAMKEVEMNRRQGIVADGAAPSWSEREAELLNVIGMAVKRKKEKHAGMGELENMKNRPMILIADRSGLDKRKRAQPVRPSLPASSVKAPWSNIPSYLLPTSSFTAFQTRAYSTVSDNNEQPQSTASHREENDSGSNNHASKHETSESAPESAVGSAFQSLSGLFRRSTSALSMYPRSGSADVGRSDEGREVEPAESSSASTWPPVRREEDRHANTGMTSTTRDVDRPVRQYKADVIHTTSARKTLEARLSRPGRSLKRRDFVERSILARTTRARANQHKVSDSSALSEAQGAPLPPWKLPTNAVVPEQSINWASTVPTGSAIAETLTPSERNDLPVEADLANMGNKIRRIPFPADETPSSQTDATTSLTHVTSSGEAHMVDVTAKESTNRIAVACGHVIFGNPAPLRLILENSNKKGDVLGTARIAGIMAAKRCSDMIPLCHPIAISKVTVNITPVEPGQPNPTMRKKTGGTARAGHGAVFIEAEVQCYGPTGVEMEALTAVTGAALTVYDMCKAVDRAMVIGGAKLLLKSGGKSGDYVHKDLKEVQIWRKLYEAAKHDKTPVS